MRKNEYKEYLKRLEAYSDNVERVYLDAVEELLKLYSRIEFNPDAPFMFSDYKNISKEQAEIMRRLHSRLYQDVKAGTIQEWGLAHKGMDDLVNSMLKSYASTQLSADYFKENRDTLESFFSKVGKDSLNLSQRVWRNVSQFKEEIEMAMDHGLRNGHSAARVGKDIRQYLDEPDKLFRRVRDEHGKLHLSKRAKAYNPGQGVYRSSYKNSLRLTVTQINMAHHEAEWERFQKLDFVVGYEIRRSPTNEDVCKVCVALEGRYPKTFKFLGWHPWCRCFMLAIMMSKEEFAEFRRLKKEGEDISKFKSKNAVTDLPEGFRDWMSENNKRILSAKSKPYFIRDNFKIDKEQLVYSPQTI